MRSVAGRAIAVARRDDLTIGPAALAAGVNVETIRFYQRSGLIPRPSAPVGGYRRYDDQAVGTVRFIKHAQELGFTLREIKELLTLHENDCAGARARAQAKLVSVEERIRDLEKIRGALRKLVRTCASANAGQPCAILEALHVGAAAARARRNGRRARETNGRENRSTR